MDFKLKDVMIVENLECAENIYKMVVKDEELAKETKPGQFYEIKVSNSLDPILRRPISVGDVNGDTITFYYKVVGKGTDLLSKEKETVNILGPLGRGFEILENKRVAIVGGGIGIAPLIYLARELKKHGNKITFFAGLRGKEENYLADLEKITAISLFSDDGTAGRKGFPVLGLEENIDNFDTVFSCGPLPLMKSVYNIVKDKSIASYFSLEERMGCGVGVCLGCVVETLDGYKLVCKDGPVFKGEVLKW